MADLLARTASFNNGARLETAVWTAKLAMLCVGTVSTFLLFKVAVVPCLVDFALSILPRAVASLRTWLSPPYIYIIVNFIIISIAASSSFHHPQSGSEIDKNRDEEEIVVGKSESADVNSGNAFSKLQCSTVTKQVSSFFPDLSDSEAEEIVVKHELTTSSKAIPCSEISVEDEGDSYEDTLDGTWKAIMEGKGTVKKPLLKKSDTWNNNARPLTPLAEVSNCNTRAYKPEMRKSETFNDRASAIRTGVGGLRRETLLLSSQDSLNERVEAFIKKFNNDMRMERQQSDMRYINIIKQAAAT